MQNKIKSLAELGAMASHASSAGRKIVLCHGCFDILHVGHSLHFEEAKRQGDLLFVTVTADEFVGKGWGRPVFNENQRALAVAAQGCVDAVAISHEQAAFGAIDIIHPDIYAKGIDYSDMLDSTLRREVGLVQFYGGRPYFTNTPKWSSTGIIAASLRTYIASFNCVLDGVEATGNGVALFLDDAVAQFTEALVALVSKKGKVVFIGNGGSAALAEHQMSHYIWAGLRCLVPTVPALTTQMSNDIAYEAAFSGSLRLMLDDGDILVAISVSGKSPNILQCVTVARKYGCRVVTLTGLSADNPLRSLGDLNFHVPSHSYGLVETAHDLILHGVAEMVTKRISALQH